MNYREYLESPQWKKLRKRVLKRDKYRCRSCGRRAWQVHHGSYAPEVMAGRELSQLFAVCGGCHLAATFTVTGAKRSKEEQRDIAALMNAPAPKFKKPKKERTRRPKLTLHGIRALSQEYAEGRMR